MKGRATKPGFFASEGLFLSLALFPARPPPAAA